MRVAWFPKTADLASNPYWPRLQDELESLGVEFETSHNNEWMQRRWLLEKRGNVKVLHFHFIQPLYYTGPELRASPRRLYKFTIDLILARLLGYRIVWTVHDLLPTWPIEPRWVERLARYVIALLAHDVIVHCEEARRLVRHSFRRSRRVWVLPLPSYADAHPNEISQTQARTHLGIPQDRFVLGFVGGIRPNKGLEDLIAAFRRVKLANAVLLLAGRPWPPQAYVNEVRRLSEEDPNIILRVEDISDEDMQIYLNAVDVMAFPFKQVLTSSSTLLAMSFGRAVIVPRLGCLPEMVQPDAGFVYAPNDVDDLAAAIEKAIAADLSAIGTTAAWRAGAHTWRDLAFGTLGVYDNA